MLTKSSAYEKWLGIREEHQPPSLYRLLAIDEFEPDSDVIANAADSRMGYVRQFQIGENSKLSAEILNDLSRAKVILLNAKEKAAYDAKLRAGKSPDQPIQVCKFEPGQAVAKSGPAAAAGFDIESLVSGPPSVASSKRPIKARKPASPLLVAGLAASLITTGCVAAGLIYVFTSGRTALPGSADTAGRPAIRRKLRQDSRIQMSRPRTPATGAGG